ncbi:hypothetical protein J6590_024198 [Homalodisca vitripennis]|nr:hypothetical protein J6590_024198 [Homalodisca vitripennis]
MTVTYAICTLADFQGCRIRGVDLGAVREAEKSSILKTSCFHELSTSVISTTLAAAWEIPGRRNSQSLGGEYVVCRKAIVVYVLQVAMFVWMVAQFHLYLARKDYYLPIRKFQVVVLMYSEIGQVLITMLLSLWIRFPDIQKYLSQCTRVVRDLEGSKPPFLARYIYSIFMLCHTLLTIYRVRNSRDRLVMMISFWCGMCQVVMIHVLLFVSLTLVDMSFKSINNDLTFILSRRSNGSAQFVHRQLCSVRQRYLRAAKLLSTARRDFGPDVFLICFIFLFKITFICYHIYYRQDISLWGQNSLVGELTGHFQIVQLLVYTFPLTYVCDSIYERMREANVLLLFLLKNRQEKKNPEINKVIKAFQVQLKSQTTGFTVCGHFLLSRQLIHNMILGVATYLFVLIQFQGLKLSTI